MNYLIKLKLESNQSPQTSAKTMLFARWQHHILFGSGFPYAPLKAMLTKISKWSRIQYSLQITPKIESLVVFAIPDIPRKFPKDPSITFWVILLTENKQTNKVWQKDNLLGGGNKKYKLCSKILGPCCKYTSCRPLWSNSATVQLRVNRKIFNLLVF